MPNGFRPFASPSPAPPENAFLCSSLCVKDVSAHAKLLFNSSMSLHCFAVHESVDVTIPEHLIPSIRAWPHHKRCLSPFENANKVANVCTARGPNPNNGPLGRTEHPPARPLCPPRRRTDQAPTLDNRGIFLDCPNAWREKPKKG
jgi:hypothetical protein